MRNKVSNFEYLILILITSIVIAGDANAGRGTTPAVTPPTSITVPASSNNGSFTVSWSGGSYATSYRLYESVNGGSYAYIYGGSSQSYARSGRGNGTYRYQAYNCNSVGCSDPKTSSVVTVVRKPAIPGQPSFSPSSLSCNDSSVSVSWSAVSGANRYYLYRSVNGGSWSTVLSNSSSRSKTESVAQNDSHRYRVRARYYLNGYYSDYSDYGSIPTAIRRPYCAPGKTGSITGPSNNVSTDGSITIGWTAASGVVARYEYRESTNGGSSYGSWKDNGLSMSQSWNGSTAKGNGSYRYQVRACNIDQCGSVVTSPVITVVRTPGSPGGISITPVGLSCGDTISLTWSQASGGNRYDIHYKQDSGSWSSLGSKISSLNTSHSSEAGHSYQYRVRAYYYLNGHYSNASAYTYSSTVRKPFCVPTTGLSVINVALGNDGKYHIGYDGLYSIQWSVSGVVSHYTLQEREPGENWEAITPSSGGSMNFSKPGNYTDAPIDYDYRIQACNVDACSTWREMTASVLNYPRPGAPGAMTILAGATHDSNGYYKVAWGASAGPVVTHYNLKRDGEALIEVSSGTDYEFFDGVPGQTYSHEVEACNTADACSDYTQAFDVYMPYPIPGRINTLEAPSRVRGGDYTVMWEAASGPVAYYQLEQNYNGVVLVLNTGLEQVYDFSGQITGDYRYRVRACNPDDVCADYSDELLVRVRNITAPNLSSVSNEPESHTGERFYGGVQGESGVSKGAATYRIPVSLPPGTAGMMPELSLSYHSQTGSQGWLGLGWSLNGVASGISRCDQVWALDGRKHSVDFTVDDRFCLDGVRLEAVNGGYTAVGTEYRTEINQFKKVLSHGGVNGDPQYFTVKTPNGNTLSFGATADSRIEAQGKTQAMIWLLNKVEDRLGNHYTIRYTEENANGAYRPDKIEYTGNANASLAPYNSVRFEYESRNDTVARYLAGSKRQTLKRLTHIKTYAGTTLVKDYQLHYQDHGPIQRSLLDNITVCGRDENQAEVCSNTARFTWTPEQQGWSLAAYEPPDDLYEFYVPGRQGQVSLIDFDGDGLLEMGQKKGDNQSSFINTGQGWVSNAAYIYPDSIDLGSDGWDKGIRLVDFNADGLVDIVRGFSTGENGVPVLDAWKNTGSGWAAEPSGGFIPPGYITHYIRGVGSFSGARIIDVNGDALPDFVLNRPNETAQTWLNNGTTWVASQHYRLPVSLHASSSSAAKYEIKLQDFNGDGLPDLLLGWESFVESPQFPARVWINNGVDGWVEETSSSATTYKDIVTAYSQNVRLADLNGDGLPDLLHYHDDNDSGTTDLAAAYLNTGTSWVNAAGFAPPAVLTREGEAAYAVKLKDVNGDGLPDFLNGRSDSQEVWLNTGHGWQYSSLFALPTQTVQGGLRGQFEDVNGDGIVDLLRNTSQTIPEYTKAVWENRSKTILLEKVTDGLGNEVEYFYKPLTDDEVYSSSALPAYPEQALQNSRYVVTDIQRSDGIGGKRLSRYHYQGLKKHLTRKQSLGFAQITQTDMTMGEKTITSYHQAFPKIGLISHVDVKSTYDNGLLKQVSHVYNVQPQSGLETTYPYLYKKTETYYEPETGRELSKHVTTSQNPDAFGNLQSVMHQISDSINNETYKTVTMREYQPDEQHWQLRLLEHESVKKYINGLNDTGKNRQTDFTYYPNGLMETRIQENQQGAPYELMAAYTYDGFGNLTAETISGPSIQTRQTVDIQYDSRGQFPSVIKNALQHSEVFEYDDRFGTLKHHTDANGQVTVHEADAFGRIQHTTLPDGTVSDTVFYTTADLPHAVFYSSVSRTGAAPVRRYYDKLGRVLRVRSIGYDGRYVYQDNEYNARGHAKQTEPYFEDDIALWNIPDYDEFNRVRSITAADSAKDQIIHYDGFTATVTDNGNHTTRKRYNAAGWLIEAVDAEGTVIRYDYDAWGRPETVTNAYNTILETQVSTQYDRLGRKTEVVDPNAGKITYAYNNALAEETTEVTALMRAAEQTRVLKTDILGRPVERQEPEGLSTWQWDDTSADNLGIGRLYRESQGEFMRTYQFQPSDHGRLSRVTTQIGTELFTIGKGYDSHGRLDELTYPASPGYPFGLKVKYRYTALGHLERISNAADASQVYYQVLDRDASGRLTDHWLGDGSTTARLYRTGSAQLDTLFSSDVQQNTLQSQQYFYDSLGRMSERRDNANGLSEHFSYDNLHRVTGATVGTQITSYEYDAIGNLTGKSDVGTFKYGAECASPGRPHAVCEKRATDNTLLNVYQYDDNGNFMSDGVRNLSWTSYNKVTRITQGNITREFDYGPARQRYRQVHTSGADISTTLYIEGLYERMSANNLTTHRHYIQAGAQTVAIQTTGLGMNAMHYLHKDHLGSVSTVTDEYGDVVERNSYDVWGKRRNAQTWLADNPVAEEVRGYTGHEHMDDIGLVNMNGRVYDNSLGRMLSADPLVSAPEFSQSWNRYSYVMNNPLRYTDPSGYAPEDPANPDRTVTTEENERNRVDLPEVIGVGHRGSYDPFTRSTSGHQALMRLIRQANRYMEWLYYAGQNTTISQRMVECGGTSCSETTVTLDDASDNVQNALDAIRNDNSDLRVPPSSDDIGRLPSDDPALGTTDVLSGDISINEDFFDNDLSDGMAQNLLETLMHEVLHHNQNILERFLDTYSDHIDIYNEADRRLFDGREYDDFNRARGK